MNKTLEVSELMIQRFECEYPSLDVRQEIRNMQNWWLANPRKHKKDEYRFVINWLNRAYAGVVASAVRTRCNYRDALVGSHSRTPSKEQLEQYERNAREGYWHE